MIENCYLIPSQSLIALSIIALSIIVLSILLLTDMPSRHHPPASSPDP